jgi:glucose-6-phosphate 1-dehydrogenase
MAPESAHQSDTLVMFGASGDLAKKKLFPAVYRLAARGLLDVPVVGVAFSEWTDDDLRQHARDAVTEDPDVDLDPAVFDALAERLTFVKGDYNDTALYPAIRERVGDAAHAIFHLAIPPSLFATVADGLAAAGLNQGSRLIIEKPFGRDLESAKALNADLEAHFAEEQIFRIDHFLGKEALRNLLVQRFSNTIIEPVWNHEYVAAVKITMAEEFGVEDRGAFYDSVGALKDVVQNHLLQMTSLIAMEQPADESPEALRDEKVRVLEAVKALNPDDMVRGQHRGYHDVEGVAPDSDTETFVALRLEIDTPRWQGVPFFIRTGKALAETITEWTVEFHSPARPLFVENIRHRPPHNTMRIMVKPSGPMAICILAKVPGEEMHVAPVDLEPTSQLEGTETEPYELLIEEAMKGDPTLFARIDSVLESWRIVDPILDDHHPVDRYEKGTWGPSASRELAAGDGGWPSEPRV